MANGVSSIAAASSSIQNYTKKNLRKMDNFSKEEPSSSALLTTREEKSKFSCVLLQW